MSANPFSSWSRSRVGSAALHRRPRLADCRDPLVPRGSRAAPARTRAETVADTPLEHAEERQVGRRRASAWASRRKRFAELNIDRAQQTPRFLHDLGGVGLSAASRSCLLPAPPQHLEEVLLRRAVDDLVGVYMPSRLGGPENTSFGLKPALLLETLASCAGAPVHGPSTAQSRRRR